MNHLWKELYGLPKTQNKKSYRSKKDCINLSEKKNVKISFDYYGKGKHKIIDPEHGILLCIGLNELYCQIELA